MISFPTITVESILSAITTFAIILVIISIIISKDKLYCKIPPWIINTISIIAIARLMYPFDIVWGHEYLYRGVFKNILLSVNRVWDRDIRILSKVSIVTVLFILWISGAIIRIIKMILDYRASMTFIRLYSTDATEDIIFEKCLSESDSNYIRRHGIKVMKSDRICAPFCCGLYSPTILIPDKKEILEKYTKIIISHEIDHIRHGDLKKKFIMVVLKLVYWWFPLFDKICQYISLAMEMQIDGRVSRDSKIEYMSSIVDIMQIMGSEQDKLGDCLHPVSLFSNESDMKKRFKRMTKNGQESVILSCFVLFVSFTVFLFSTLICMHADGSFEEQKEIDTGEEYYFADATNSKIIALENGNYEVHVILGNGGEFSYVQDDLFGLSEDVPMYNEEGGRIRWPYFHRLK